MHTVLMGAYKSVDFGMDIHSWIKSHSRVTFSEYYYKKAVNCMNPW